MTTTLALQPGLPGTLLDNGYVLPPNLTFDEWQAIVALIEHIVAASPWWLVDAIEYGRQSFSERHTQVFPTVEDDPTGASQARLAQASWMADCWPRSTRVLGQSYSGHRAVAKLVKLDRDSAVSLLSETDQDGRRLTVKQLAARADTIEASILGHATLLPTTNGLEGATDGASLLIPLGLLQRLVGALAERFSRSGHPMQMVTNEHRGYCRHDQCVASCIELRALFHDAVAVLEGAGLTPPGGPQRR